jgi:hypothetical protein
MSWSQAYADYAFNFNSGDGSIILNGTLQTELINGGQTTLITGGSLYSTGTIDGGTTFTVASLTSALGPVNIAQYSGYSTFLGYGGAYQTYTNVLNTATPSTPFPITNWGVNNTDLILAASTNTSTSGYYLALCYDGGSTYDVDIYPVAGTYPTDPTFSAATANITPTPIPAATWLLGSGLMGLFGMRRKEKV